MSRYSRRIASSVVRPNITSSFEYPKTNASFLSIRVTSTLSASASDNMVASSRPPKPAPRTTMLVSISGLLLTPLPLFKGAILVVETEVAAGEPPLDGTSQRGASAPAVGVAGAHPAAGVVDP